MNICTHIFHKMYKIGEKEFIQYQFKSSTISA